MSRWKGRSEKAMEELGLNDGGKVMKKPDKAKGGPPKTRSKSSKSGYWRHGLEVGVGAKSGRLKYSGPSLSFIVKSLSMIVRCISVLRIGGTKWGLSDHF